MEQSKKVNSLQDLAKLSSGFSMVFIQVYEETEDITLRQEVNELLIKGEAYIPIKIAPWVFYEIGKPESLPTIGAWSSKGAFIDFMQENETLTEFTENMRRFS